MTEDQKLEAPANGNWRPVFIVSDGTAITAETLAHSVLTQFPNLSYDRERIPFIDTVEKAKQTAERINAVQRRTGVRPLVFSTFVDPVISRSFINSNEGFQIELFRSFVGPLEHELCMKSEGKRVYVTLGQFSIIRLERETQLLMPVYDYCMPEKECACGSCGEEDPCELFRQVKFPVSEFFPPNAMSCGEGGKLDLPGCCRK